MSKHSRLAFGLFEDGHTIRLVQLYKDKGQFLLQGIDRVELDQALYHAQEMQTTMQDYEKSSWEDNSGSSDKLILDELEEDFSSDVKLSPWDAMLTSVDLKGGVIAVNVNDDYLIKSREQISNSHAIKRYAKTVLSPEEFRQGDWQSSRVNIGGSSVLWIHRGPNLLLELIQDYRKKNHLQLIYQLADANDVVLTDYFRIFYLDPQQRTMLIHLAQDHRKAFVFEGGKWINSLQLQISQRDPEPEVVYSKLSLALDSANERDPERLVVCGELANLELLEHLHQQYPSTTVELLSFAELAVPNNKIDTFSAEYLAQYAMPVALAIKALSWDDHRWTDSNFLPPRIMEGQKVFKIAWHGFIVLFMIFVVTFWATVSILKTNQVYRENKGKQRELNFTLFQRRKEAAEIRKIKADLENQENSIEELQVVLENKNPWTEVLSVLNRVLAEKSTSWLTSLKTEKGKLYISGVTTLRANIIEISEAFPNSRIMKILFNKIRDQNIWTFEIVSDLPKVDWSGYIRKDFELLKSYKGKFEHDVQNKTDSIDTSLGFPNGTPKASKLSGTQEIQKQERAKLPPLSSDCHPFPDDTHTLRQDNDAEAYKEFIKAVENRKGGHYKDLGIKFLKSHKESTLIPYVRWWMGYRLYTEGNIAQAKTTLSPVLLAQSDVLPYAMLLNARISYTLGNKDYEKQYQKLISDYSKHPVIGQTKRDMALLKIGGKND